MLEHGFGAACPSQAYLPPPPRVFGEVFVKRQMETNMGAKWLLPPKHLLDYHGKLTLIPGTVGREDVPPNLKPNLCYAELLHEFSASIHFKHVLADFRKKIVNVIRKRKKQCGRPCCSDCSLSIPLDLKDF